MNGHDPADAGADRLIILADALTLVPLSETASRGPSAARMIGSRARRRSVANIYRGCKSAGGRKAHDDDQWLLRPHEVCRILGVSRSWL